MSTAPRLTTGRLGLLLALYDSTNGNSWSDKSSWKTPPLDADGFALPGTECSWHGITCNADQTAVSGYSEEIAATTTPVDLVRFQAE